MRGFMVLYQLLDSSFFLIPYSLFLHYFLSSAFPEMFSYLSFVSISCQNKYFIFILEPKSRFTFFLNFSHQLWFFSHYIGFFFSSLLCSFYFNNHTLWFTAVLCSRYKVWLTWLLKLVFSVVSETSTLFFPDVHFFPSTYLIGSFFF